MVSSRDIQKSEQGLPQSPRFYTRNCQALSISQSLNQSFSLRDRDRADTIIHIFMLSFLSSIFQIIIYLILTLLENEEKTTNDDDGMADNNFIEGKISLILIFLNGGLATLGTLDNLS